MRIVSLLPSATEIVWALGAGGELVGRSAECDHPPGVEGLPIVMRARTLDSDRPSGEIDARVRTANRAQDSLYTLDLDRLRSLAPDLLLTQDLCRVCSVTDEEVGEACRIAGVSPRVVSLSPRTLAEVWDSVRVIGAAVQRTASAEALADSLVRRTKLGPLGAGPAAPRVALLEWLDPPILAGLWAPEMVAAAGGSAIALEASAPALRTRWGALASTAPDLVVVSPCSFTVDRTRRELRTNPTIAGALGQLSPRLGTWLADEAYFSRPGPRLAAGVELLRALLSGRRPAGPMPVERWGA